MFSLFTLYKNAFGGLSTDSWILSIIMFINRSGSMVIPFMSIYLKEDLDFTIKEAGFLMAIFGVGSMVGALLGGWLTDKIGHFKVQVWSLILGGGMFFVLIYVKEFYGLLIAVFILSSISESLRPANASSVSFYSKPETITQSFALNRMALNLGFAIGPAIGGLLAAISYQWLFIADGSTCILAGILFYFVFRNKKGSKKQSAIVSKEKIKSPYQDKKFLLFIFFVTLFAIAFFQLFTTLPLYYREECDLSKSEVGMLLGLNGLIVFVFEMVLVYKLKERKNIQNLIVIGLLLTGVAYFILNLSTDPFILILSMIILSFAEIFAMPFMATITVQSSDENNRGKYMGLYTFAYSLAFVFAPFSGTLIAYNFGFNMLWWLMSGICLLLGLGFFILIKK